MAQVTTRAAIYFRGSFDSEKQQKLIEQGEAIDLVQRRRYHLVDAFLDEERRTKKARRRPGIQKLLIAARARRFDVLVINRIDQVFGSLHELVVVLDALREHGLDFVSAQEPSLDTTRGSALYEIVETFAKLERTVRVGRTRLGLELARRAGKKLGRPRKQFSLRRALELRDRDGESYSAIARKLGQPKPFVYRRLREHDAVSKSSLH